MVKPGFIQVNKINKHIKKTHSVKIGGKAYMKALTDRVKFLKKKRDVEGRNVSKKLKNQRRVFKKYLPNLYERQETKDIRGLLQYRHEFNKNDKSRVKRIIKQRVKKPGKKIVYFKFKGASEFSNKAYPLGDRESQTVKALIKFITEGKIDTSFGDGSDVWNQLGLTQLEDFRIKTITEPEFLNVVNKNGSFFRYLNTTSINLERYQIISKDSDMKLLNEHCLIYALKMLNVEECFLNSIKSTFECGSYFAKKNLNKVCDILKQNIILTCFDGTKKRTSKFGNYKTSLNLALYQDHYFTNEPTKYTLYSSKNYQSIKDEKEFFNIYKKGRRTTENKQRCDSLVLVKNLLETGNFIKDHPILKSTDKYQKYNDKIETLDIIKQEQEPYHFEFKKQTKKNIFYCDTETDTTGDHKLFLIGAIKESSNISIDDAQTFLNYDGNAFKKFMKYIYSQTSDDTLNILYFHNLKFDYHILTPYIYHYKAPCEKDGQIYEVVIMYNGRKFNLRDSYKLASFPLSKFQKTFNLPSSVCKKEAIAYEYYKLSNVNDDCVDIQEYKKFLTKEQQKIFMEALEENIDFNYNSKNKTFDPIEYYKYYLLYDVYVLALGMIKFKKIIDNITKKKLNLHDYLTISSITFNYMGMQGCFDGVSMMCGNLREFVGKAITGGRVQTNYKYTKKVIEQKIADYDGVSLYPSAISRMCKETGLPLGNCKRITQYIKKELDNFDYYIVKIQINKINKYQQLPMVSYKNEDGILQYVNKIKEPIITYVDMITLSDWIEFQGIEYKIIDGVYYNNGFNNKMGSVVEYLFTERLKQKKAGNQALQQIFKLMLNSAYGKTITKKTMTKKTIVKDNLKDSYIYNNFNTIKSIETMSNGQSIIEQNSVDDSFNMGQVGVYVLSYSKRIMNEVFSICEENNCPLYYTDTDSIHCNFDDVPVIEKAFRKKYNRELTGKQLGQFHIDFDMTGACSEIYATKSIFLGKKCYIDMLESTDKDGKLINSYHMRMKGVSVQSINHCAKKYFDNDYFKVYEHLTKESLEFVLNPKGLEYKPSFVYKNHRVQTIQDGSFKRVLSF